MRAVLGFAVAVSALAIYFAAADASEPPTAEALVAAPRAQVFGQLDPLFAAIEAKATTMTTVTGKPPIVVKYTFVREPGEQVGFTAKAGFRTVALKVRLADGDQPGTTKLRIVAEPESLLSSSKKQDALSALTDVLERAEPQFAEGARVNALFDSGLYRPDMPDRPYGTYIR